MGKDIGLDQLTSVVNNAKYLKEKKSSFKVLISCHESKDSCFKSASS